ncbi:MAG: aspartate carbamoyltransferase catalytic subunit [Pseudomonadota bacterium]
MTDDPWKDLLDPGERIIWQGRPDPGFGLTTESYLMIPFGAVFTVFALFWMAMASMGSFIFSLFGLPFVAVGAGMLFWGVYGPTLTRRHTWYTLTNKRGFIATDLPLQGRKLTSYPIMGAELELIDSGGFETVNFAEKVTRTKKHGTSRVPIGFKRLEESREVYRLMRDIQRGDIE